MTDTNATSGTIWDRIKSSAVWLYNTVETAISFTETHPAVVAEAEKIAETADPGATAGINVAAEIVKEIEAVHAASQPPAASV